MNNFKTFVDERGRWAKKQLGVLKTVLERHGLKTEDHTKEGEPYIYVKSNQDLSFGGVRIYKIGDNIAFRIQNESSTHPYGRAYPLDVDDMYEDLMSGDVDEEKAGRQVIDAIVQEITKFFEQSMKAEQDLKVRDLGRKKKVSLIEPQADLWNQVVTKM